MMWSSCLNIHMTFLYGKLSNLYGQQSLVVPEHNAELVSIAQITKFYGHQCSKLSEMF